MKVHRILSSLLLISLCLLAAACSLTGKRPPAPELYDLGAPISSSLTTALPAGVDVVLAELEVPAWLNGSEIFYRRAEEPYRLQAYSLSRWAAPPAVLLEQHLRHGVERLRPAIPEAGEAPPEATLLLHIDIERFEQIFDDSSQSHAELRLRTELTSSSGRASYGSKIIDLEAVAPQPNAGGGVEALAGLTRQAIAELTAWIGSLDLSVGSGPAG